MAFMAVFPDLITYQLGIIPMIHDLDSVFALGASIHRTLHQRL